MLAFFNYSVLQFDFHEFYYQLIESLVWPSTLSLTEKLDRYRQFAFVLYDVNVDQYVDQTDLFSLFKQKINDKVCPTVFNDFRDIQACLNKKQKDIQQNDAAGYEMVADQETGQKQIKIRDMERYIN